MAGPDVVFKRRPHLRRQNVGERGLAQAGRAVEQRMVKRLVALKGGADGDVQVGLEQVLPHVVFEAAGAESGV